MRFAASFALTVSLLTPIGRAQAQVPGLPEAVPAGSASFSVLGLRIYQARLWVAPGFRQSTWSSVPLALELAYERSFSGADIARRSVQEMQRAGSLDEAQARRWETGLRELLPDVRPGDRLLGVHRPGRGAEFYQGGRALGRIDDAEFARRFFAIWLGPATSAPALREALFAGTAP